jgi:hypothetical protein
MHYSTGISLDGLRKTKRNLSQDSSREPPEYKSRASNLFGIVFRMILTIILCAFWASQEAHEGKSAVT